MPNWRPDFLTLKLFVAVCEENSISHAAEREAIATSAISKRLAELEENLAVPLLTRGNRGVSPTSAGLSFLNHAREILLHTERLQNEMSDYSKGEKGQVQLYANASSIIQFLSRDISSFLRQHPLITIDLQERTSSEVAAAVLEGKVDIGICLGNVDAEGLQLRSYSTDSLVVVVHHSHPLAHMRAIGFKDILDCDFISLQAHSRTTSFLKSQAAAHGKTLNFRAHVDSLDVVLYLVAQNIGVAVLANGIMQSLKTQQELRAVPLSDSWSQREIKIYLRSYAALSQPSKLFVDHLASTDTLGIADSKAHVASRAPEQ